jgi:glyoxylase-like metal-dependent hydrolase (beta-lactamase superfamily II)
MILAGPPVRNPGTTDALVHVMDLLPTFAALAGAPVDDLHLDGVSLVPVLRDRTASVREVVYTELRHPSVGPILVDTGLHPSIATDGKENFGTLGNRFGKPQLQAGEDVPSQLRKRNLDPGEVPIVVMTHLHSDHTSAISEFPNSTFVISATEWEAGATGSQPTLNGYRRPHFDYAFDYRTVDFDRDQIDSYASFGRTFDLFGDGSVRLAFTPGHSAGHMSVVCHLKERDFVIGGDAMYMRAQLDGEAPLPPRPFDAHNFRRSLQELRLFHGQFPEVVITPGHDPEFYAGLNARYE